METAVGFEDLTLAYGARVVIPELSGRLARGRLHAIMGPNGAGKSTLLNAIAGMHHPAAGRVWIEPGLRLAYLPQANHVDRQFPVHVFDFVAMGLWPQLGALRGADAAQKAAVSAALATLGLAGHERRLLDELSRGQLQRVLFARVMLQNADLILLDEPFNAVDAPTTLDLMALLHRWQGEGRTVIAVLHDAAQVCDHFDETLLLGGAHPVWMPARRLPPVATVSFHRPGAA